MKYPENIQETIELCSEEYGIDLAFVYNDCMYIIFENTERTIRVTEFGDITYVIDEFTGKEDIELYKDIDKSKLSFLGSMIYRWVEAGYTKVPPLFMVEIWRYFEVDMLGYSVDYDKDLTESVMRYLVYTLGNIGISTGQPKVVTMKRLEEHAQELRDYDREMGCAFCYGYIKALCRGTESDIILYI